MDIRAEEISKIIRDQIGSYALDVDVAEVGTVARQKAPSVAARRTVMTLG